MNILDYYKNKRVYITGHTGFKGSWLTQILLKAGAKVTGFSLEPNSKPALFTILELGKKINHHIGDIRNYQEILSSLEESKPEIIFHLAAQPLVRPSYDDPIYTFDTNTLGTAKVLEAIRNVNSVKAAVLITTDKVYANKGSEYSYNEEDKLGGYDPYSSSKAAAEIIIDSYSKSFFNPQDYNKTHHTLIGSTRAGNVIGGGDWSKDRLIVDIVRAIFEIDEEIIIRNPQAVRPWQHVLEPLYGYLLLGKKLFDGEKRFVGGWNFGPIEKNIKVVDLVMKGIEILGKGSYRVLEDSQKHEAMFLNLDVKKATSNLKWTPQYSIETSLKMTFEWYKRFYNNQDVIEFTDSQINTFFRRT